MIDEAVEDGTPDRVAGARALVKQDMDTTKVLELKQQMERAMARRIQPHYVHDFFMEAFKRLGGKAFPREEGRYEITHIRRFCWITTNRSAPAYRCNPGTSGSVLRRSTLGSPGAELVSPGHPLLEVCISLIWNREGNVLSQGAILVDDNDPGSDPGVVLPGARAAGRSQEPAGSAALDLQPAGVP